MFLFPSSSLARLLYGLTLLTLTLLLIKNISYPSNRRAHQNSSYILCLSILVFSSMAVYSIRLCRGGRLRM